MKLRTAFKCPLKVIHGKQFEYIPYVFEYVLAIMIFNSFQWQHLRNGGGARFEELDIFLNFAPHGHLG